LTFSVKTYKSFFKELDKIFGKSDLLKNEAYKEIEAWSIKFSQLGYQLVREEMKKGKSKGRIEKIIGQRYIYSLQLLKGKRGNLRILFAFFEHGSIIFFLNVFYEKDKRDYKIHLDKALERIKKVSDELNTRPYEEV
jgi:hypothetical protein